MNWLTIAAVQKVCAPTSLGRFAYRGMQRRFGGLRHGIRASDYQPVAQSAISRVRQSRGSFDRATVVEVGTGYCPTMPILFWLSGAQRTHSFDLHRHLREDLTLQFVQSLAGCSVRYPERLLRLLGCKKLQDVLQVACINYHAPADAAFTSLAPGSVDLHFSNNVLEHVPSSVIVDILREGARLLSTDGVAYHRVNPADHFGRYDRKISSVNFLRFGEGQWRRIAGNTLAYHNRLRAVQYRHLFQRAGHQIVDWIETEDPAAAETIRSGFRVNSAFAGYTPEELCVAMLEVESLAQKADLDHRVDTAGFSTDLKLLQSSHRGSQR
jgi:hypothetical protein